MAHRSDLQWEGAPWSIATVSSATLGFITVKWFELCTQASERVVLGQELKLCSIYSDQIKKVKKKKITYKYAN